MKERVRLLERELAAARAALMRYGQHEPTCPWLVDTLPCTCGFAAIEAASRRAAEEEP